MPLAVTTLFGLREPGRWLPSISFAVSARKRCGISSQTQAWFLLTYRKEIESRASLRRSGQTWQMAEGKCERLNMGPSVGSGMNVPCSHSARFYNAFHNPH
jgi:hypothetical protein